MLLLLGCRVPGLARNHLPHARSTGEVFPESAQRCPGKLFVRDFSHFVSSYSVSHPHRHCLFACFHVVDHVSIRSLTTQATSALIHSFISSRIDIGNSTYSGLGLSPSFHASTRPVGGILTFDLIRIYLHAVLTLVSDHVWAGTEITLLL